MNNHFPPVHRNIQSAPKHIFDITHHFEDVSKLLFLFIDRKFFSLLKSGGGWWRGGGGKRRKGFAKWLKPCPAKPDPAFLARMPASPSHPPPNPTLLCQGGKNIIKASKAVNERKDGCGQVRIEENPYYPSYLWKTGCFWGTPWPWRAGVRHKPSHFISQREAVLGNGPAQQDHPRLQLGGFGEMVTHGREERGKGELAQLHQLERLTEGLVGLLSMELGKRSSRWPAEDGSPSRQGQRVREEMWELGSRWWRERVNTDAYLLPAACQEKESRTPGSSFKSQAMSSGHILCWLKPSWTSVKSSIPSWRAWWYSSPAPWAGPGGGSQ